MVDGKLLKKKPLQNNVLEITLHITETVVPHSGTQLWDVLMKIEIKLFASLRVERFKTEVREYPPATGIRQVVRGLGILEKDVGIVLLNGQHASLEDSLKNGDTLSLLPLVDGG